MRRWLLVSLFAFVGLQAKADTLEIGYMPILPVSQLFVGLENGQLEAIEADTKLIQFQNGPAMVQALLGGQLDIAYLGIGPAMVARGKGADIKVVASNIVEQISFIALPELAASFESGTPETAFQRFTQDQGRKPVIATFPVGSVPDTVLQFWLAKGLGVPADSIEVIYQGAAQVQQALATGAVDGAAILEPVVSSTLARINGARVIASGSELFPNQPGAVLVMRESLIAERPELARAWVAAHNEATEELASGSDEAVSAIKKYVGGGRLPEPVVRAALGRSQQSFVANPNSIVEGTRVMHDFQAEQGTLKAAVDLDQLFDLSLFPES